MQEEDRRAILDLLHAHRVLTLAVLVDGEPYASALPFALRPDLGGALVHASKLARHSRGLSEGAPFSVVIQSAEGKGGDRSTCRGDLHGRVRTIDRGSREWEEGRATFVARLPEGEMMFSLGDFGLYELHFEHGRYFAGFRAHHQPLARVAPGAGRDGVARSPPEKSTGRVAPRSRTRGDPVAAAATGAAQGSSFPKGERRCPASPAE